MSKGIRLPNQLPGASSIRNRLLLGFVVLVLLPAAIISLTSAFLSWQNGQQQVINQLKSVATLKEAEIEAWAANLQTNLALELTEPERSWLATVLTPAGEADKQPAAIDNLRREWGQFIDISQAFTEIFLMDTSGRVLLSSDRRQEDTIHITQPYFQMGLTGPYIQPPFYFPSLQKMTVVATRPVEDAQGQVIGVLAGRASTHTLIKVMRTSTGLGTTGETYLVGANNVLLTDTPQMSAAGLTSAAASNIHTQGIHLGAEQRLRNAGLYPNYQNIPVIGVYHWLPTLQVALLAEQAQSEAFSPIFTGLLLNAVITIVAVGLAISAALAVTRGITVPLGNLTRTARQIADGNLDLTAMVGRTDDELGTLAGAFNDMTARLRSTITSLEQAQEIALLGSFEFDLNSLAITWSDQVYVIFGQESGTDITFERYQNLLDTDDFIRVMDAVTRTMETKNPYEVEHIIRFDDESEKYVYAIGWPVIDDDGKVTRIVGTIQDVTQRKRAEAELEQERSLLRTLIDHLPDMVYAKDTDGHFLITNPAHIALLGYEHEHEVLGKTSDDHQPPEIAKTIANDDQRVLQTAEPIINREEPITNHHGQLRWMLTTKTPLYDQVGTVIGLLGISRDITERRQAEAALRVSEQRFRSLFQESPVLLWEEDMSACKAIIDGLHDQGVDDLDTYFDQHPEVFMDIINNIKLLDANQATLDFYGVKDQETLWSRMTRAWTEEGLEGFKAELLALDHGRLSFTGRVNRIHMDNDEDRYIIVHTSIPPEHNETWSRVFVSIIDVTQQVQAEQAIRDSEQRFRSLFQESPIPLWEEDMSACKVIIDGLHDQGVDDLDTYFDQHPETLGDILHSIKFLDANRAALDFYEVSDPPALWDLIVANFTKEKIGRIKSEIVTLAQGHGSFTGDVGQPQLPSGDEKYAFMHIAIPPEHSETWSRVFVSIIDMTQQVRAEQALRESEGELRTIFNRAPTGISVVSLDLRILRVNPAMCQFTGYTEAELLTKTVEDITHPDDHTKNIYVEDLEQQTTPFIELEKRYRRKDGTIVHGISRVTALTDPDGKPVAMLTQVLDVTKRKQAEDEIHRLNADLEQRVIERTQALLASNNELESFAYSVSHDLRTPLRAINGYSHVLEEDYTDVLDDDGRDALRRIGVASQRMGQIIDDLLALSRVTRLEVKRETVDLGALAQTIADQLSNNQPDRVVTWSIAANIEIEGDSRLLRLALENLIGNAWKFTSKEAITEIEFGTTQIDNQPVYVLRDNGVGFDMTYSDKLFGPFQRLHSYQDFEGTGIGLATVERIIRRHGGLIWAESEPGQGAAFYFTLNRLDETGTDNLKRKLPTGGEQ